jgi:undecaprenyl-phosphate 4-deoxy-4-formamido-L-arabinose transferase
MSHGNDDRNVSVVVPVYNGELNLPHLVSALGSVLPRCCGNYELVLVNDASPDRSWEIIRGLAERHSWVRGINLLRNYGQHNALLCGIRAARYDTIVTMDDDLQNPPEEIPKLLDKLEQGYDVVYGVPARQQHGLWRDLASLITKAILKNAMGAETARSVSAFRAFDARVRQGFQDYHGPFVSIDVLLTWGAARFATLRVRHDPRRAGASGYSLHRLIVHALNMLTGFSVLPLQIASVVGFACTLFGIVVFAYVIGRYLLQGSPVPGFPFLASIIAIFSGAQLFALGIIGEYLARMHFRMMERPAYIVRTTTFNTKQSLSADTPALRVPGLGLEVLRPENRIS